MQTAGSVLWLVVDRGRISWKHTQTMTWSVPGVWVCVCLCVWLCETIFRGMCFPHNLESLTSTYISKITISDLSDRAVKTGCDEMTVMCFICLSVMCLFTIQWTRVYMRGCMGEWESKKRWICWGFLRGDGRGVGVGGGGVDGGGKSHRHGKSSQQASQIPWCPASRPKWPIRHVYSSPPPSADAALFWPDEKRWQLRRRLISVTIKT